MKIRADHARALAAMEDLRFDEARDLLEGAAESSGSWIAENDLALCRYALGEVEPALEMFDRILDREPANGFARINRYYVIEADKIKKAPQPDPGSKIIEQKGGGAEDPSVSIIMPTFNRPGLIRQSIESVLTQSFTDWELIVVNDGGTREVEKTLEQYLKDPRVRYVYAEHGGLSSSANVGLHLARGSFLCELDDDDVFYENHLSTLAGHFEKNPASSTAFTDFYRARMEQSGGKLRVVSRKLAYAHEFDYKKLMAGNYIPICAMLFHRRCIEEEGGFNESISRAINWEFFLRITKKFPPTRIAKVTGEFREHLEGVRMARTSADVWNHSRNSISFLHHAFPLTGARFLPGDKSGGERFKRALERLIENDDEFFFAGRLELRKLLAEPGYAMFYTLGKRLSEEGCEDAAKKAFRAALKLRPWEIKTWAGAIRP